MCLRERVGELNRDRQRDGEGSCIGLNTNYRAETYLRYIYFSVCVDNFLSKKTIINCRDDNSDQLTRLVIFSLVSETVILGTSKIHF